MNIVMFYADRAREWNSSQWRMRIPAEALIAAGHSVTMIFWEEDNPNIFKICSDADVLIFERLLTPLNVERMKLWKRHGKKIVVDFDDAYDLMTPDNPVYVSWHETTRFAPEPLGVALKKYLYLADLVQVPCKMLAEYYRPYCSKIAVVPNYPSFRMRWAERYPVQVPGLIGWGGGMTHTTSFAESGVVPALEGRNVIIWGGNPQISKLLPGARWVPQVPYTEWPYEIGRISIGIAPLAGEYDKYRSWIKCVEFALKSIPWVATAAPPYEECRGGILVQNETDLWGKALDLLEDEAIYNQLSEEGWEWAWKLGIDDHIGERIALYEEE